MEPFSPIFCYDLVFSKAFASVSDSFKALRRVISGPTLDHRGVEDGVAMLPGGAHALKDLHSLLQVPALHAGVQHAPVGH